MVLSLFKVRFLVIVKYTLFNLAIATLYSHDLPEKSKSAYYWTTWLSTWKSNLSIKKMILDPKYYFEAYPNLFYIDYQ